MGDKGISMLKQSIVLSVGLAVLGASAVAVSAGEPVEIRPKLASGSVWYAEFVDVLEQNIAVTDADTATTNSIESTFTFKETVLEQSAEKTVIGMTYDRMGMAMPMMGVKQKMHYDSEIPNMSRTGAMLGPICRNIIGGALKAEISAAGRVTSVTGMDEVVEKIAKVTLGNFMFANIKEGLTNEAVQSEYVEPRFALYPEKAVSPGESWTRQYPSAGGRMGGQITTINAKLDRVSEEGGRRVAVVSYETARAPDPTRPAQPMANGMLVDSGGSKSRGTATYDFERGMFVELREQNDGTLTIRKKATEPAAEAQVMARVSTRGTRTMTILTEEQRSKQKTENAAKAAEAKKAEEEKAKARGEAPKP